MRILIDECLPKRFARDLHGHEVLMVGQNGWLGKKNGDLLKCLSDNDFEVFITVDQNFQYQQNLKDTKVAVFVLPGVSSRYDDLKLLVSSVYLQLASVVAGTIYIIDK